MKTLKIIHWMSGRKLEIHRTSYGEVQNLLKETIKWQLHIQQDRTRQILQEDVGESVGDEQKDHRMTFYGDFAQTCQTNPHFLSCIATRKRILGVAVQSWNKTSDHAVGNKIISESQTVCVPVATTGWTAICQCLPPFFAFPYPGKMPDKAALLPLTCP